MCLLRWESRNDWSMGLNHQMSSLNCAMMDAVGLERRLLVPSRICVPAVHRRLGQPRCVGFFYLFDADLLKRVVEVVIDSQNRTAPRVWIGATASAFTVRKKFPCSKVPVLGRRIDTGFWFQQCLRRRVDYRPTLERLRVLLGPTSPTIDPTVHLLRSGLFYSAAIREAAVQVRHRIGSAYVGVHVRRSDKLRECQPRDCQAWNSNTRPDAIGRLLERSPRLASLPVFVASTERDVFFASLRRRRVVWTLSNFSFATLRHPYAIYATESLVLFGSLAVVETLSHSIPWLTRACFASAASPVFNVTYGGACTGCVGCLHPPTPIPTRCGNV